MFLIYCYSTFVCPTELIAFSDKANDFAKIDCQVIGVSTDSEFSHLAWINTPRKVITICNKDNLHDMYVCIWQTQIINTNYYFRMVV